MKKQVEENSWLWLATMACAGTVSTFLGPFLGSLSTIWSLQDRQAGLLISGFFVGSLLGTLSIGNDLRRTLVLGSSATSAGLLGFAMLICRPNGYLAGVATLIIVGFGLGQLMSSINLLVGTSPPSKRSSALARLGGAWCVGALFSPVLTTRSILHVSPTLRLACFALLFVVPAMYANRRQAPSRGTSPSGTLPRKRPSALVLRWVAIILVYGGIEASIAAWSSVLAGRYYPGAAGLAPWTTSVFWGGLILGRGVTSKVVRPHRVAGIIQAALVCSAASLLLLMVCRTLTQLLSTILISGICMAPLFPLLLSTVLECGWEARTMGVILASSALGAAILPASMGILSNASSLRIAMVLPLCALALLWQLSRGVLPCKTEAL